MSTGSAVPECFAVKDLITHQYDIYTLLFVLHNKSNHPGVRDFLTHKLYSQRDEDIDAILPQLCHLFMIWSPDSSVLADFFVHLCANSIHFALKINWTLRAQIYHLPSGGRHLVQKECMEKLLASCEMSLINASIIGPDGKMRKKERKPRTAANESSSSHGNHHRHHLHHHHHSHSHSHSHTHPPLPRALSGDVDADGRRRSVITSTTFHSSRDPSPVNSIQQSPRRLGDLTNINLSTVPATPPPSAFESELSPPAPVYRPPSDSPPPTNAAGAQELQQQQIDLGMIPVPSASPALSEHPISELRVSSPSVSDNEIEQQLLDVAALTLDPNATTPASTTSSASTPSSAASAPPSEPFSASTTAAAAASGSSSSSFSQLYCPSHAISIDDLVNAASSSVRAEYFKQLQKLMAEFGRISAMLVKIPHHQGRPVNLRNQKLRKFMADLAPLARYMYFPTYEPTHRHYRLLRILPEETFILNSRDKAPFLFHFEVQYTTSTLHPPAPMSVYDSDLYFAYKSKDDIIAETFGSRLKCEACEDIRKQHQNSAGASSRFLAVDGVGSEITRPASSNAGLLSAHTNSSSRASTSSSSRALDIPAAHHHHASDASSGRLVQSTSLPQEMASLLLNKSLSSDSPRSAVHHLGQPVLPPPSSRTPAPVPTSNVVAAAPRSSPSSQASSPLLRHVSLATPFETLSVQAFGESFTSRKNRVQAASPYFHTMKDTDVLSLIFKHGDDVRQEVMTMQLIRYLHNVFQHASLPLLLTPYSVDITSGQSGLIETVKDAISIDSLKKNVSAIPIHSHLTTPTAASGPSSTSGVPAAATSLASFFHYYFSLLGPELHERAVKNFAESMAAYSVISYLFQIKDRHNGNILLKMDGSVVHIDFGFVLSNSPGSNWNFEAAPFKLTSEFVQVFGGEASEMFDYYKLLVIRGYLEARKHANTILLLLQVLSVESKMACWANSADTAIGAVRERFHLDWTEEQCMEFAYGMIESSINNWRTVQYDRYQEIVNNIK